LTLLDSNSNVTQKKSITITRKQGGIVISTNRTRVATSRRVRIRGGRGGFRGGRRNFGQKVTTEDLDQELEDYNNE